MRQETFTQAQEVQGVLYKINPRRNMLRHTVTKPTEIINEEKILKASREEQQLTLKGTPVWLSADFLAETAHQKGSSNVLTQI